MFQQAIVFLCVDGTFPPLAGGGSSFGFEGEGWDHFEDDCATLEDDAVPDPSLPSSVATPKLPSRLALGHARSALRALSADLESVQNTVFNISESLGVSQYASDRQRLKGYNAVQMVLSPKALAPVLSLTAPEHTPEIVEMLSESFSILVLFFASSLSFSCS